MKFIKSKLLQRAEGKKIGKYLLTVEVTDNDIEKFEDLGGLPTRQIYTSRGNIQNLPKDYDYTKEDMILDERFGNYMKRLFHNVFQEIWRKHDY